MMSIKKKDKQIKKKNMFSNNQGAAIVLVVVIMAMMGILVAMSLYMCLANFYMKANDANSKNNFYSAEGVLEEIKAGLEKNASDATDVAYMEIMQNYNNQKYKTQEERSEGFVYTYVKEFTGAVQKGSNDREYDIDIIRAMVPSEVLTADIKTAPGATVEVADGKDATISASKDGVVLKNIYVCYKDKKGYVTKIQTDIRVGVPEISFDTAVTIPQLVNYSLIANDSIKSENSKNTNVSGCVFGGKDGIFARKTSKISFIDSELVVTNGTVSADGTDSSISVDTDSSLWTTNVVVDNGAEVKLAGTTYVKDDSTLLGDKSSLILEKQYIGFGKTDVSVDGDGDPVGKASDSSAIVINGTRATLSMEALDRLFLPGNAYIGTFVRTGKESADITPYASVGSYNNRDIMMGESVSTKVAQIAYLVPADLIGYIQQDNGSFKQVLGTNPVLQSKLEGYTKPEEAYGYEWLESDRVVDFDKYCKAKKTANGNKVAVEVYWGKDSTGIKTDTATPSPVQNAETAKESPTPAAETASDTNNLAQKYNASFIKRYVPVGGGTSDTYVYYYMTFKSQQDASKFFRDYFKEDSKHIKDYLNIYIDQLDVPVDENGAVGINNFSVAGNVIRKVENEETKEVSYELVESTLSTDIATGKMENQEKEIDFYKKAYTGYGLNLLANSEVGESISYTDANGVTQTKELQENAIFENLINVELLNKICPVGQSKIFQDADKNVKALVVNNKGQNICDVDAGVKPETSLLIATGDVQVDRAFAGTIVCGGTIYLKSEGDIQYNAEDVRRVLNIANEFDVIVGTNKEKRKIAVKDLFYSGMDITSKSDEGDGNNKLDIAGLVSYENWSKE